MRHKIAGKKLSRDTAHRQALLINLSKSLIEHGQIKTTLTRAKSLRPVIERLVTLGRKNTLASRRLVTSRLRGDQDLATKLIKEIAPRFTNRPGGYTRVLKYGFRNGDTAPMAIIEFVDYKPKEAQTGDEANKGEAPQYNYNVVEQGKGKIETPQQEASDKKEKKAASSKVSQSTSDKSEKSTTETKKQ